jgi:hypothetical protein
MNERCFLMLVALVDHVKKYDSEDSISAQDRCAGGDLL